MAGIVEVVTGAGKTTFALMCMGAFDEEYRPGSRYVILVPTLTLLDQWYVAITEDTTLPSSAVSTYSGEGIPSSPNTVNLMVINTARRMAPLVSSGGDTLLIVDECHRAGSPQNAKALEGRKSATLGLSATPEREYDEGFEAMVRPHLGGIVFRYGYNEAVRDGVIVPFELINVEFPLTPTESAAYDRASKRVARLRAGQVEGRERAEPLRRALMARAKISNEARLRVPTAVRLVEQHKGTRCVVFHERITAAEEIAQILRTRGHSVATYHSGIGPELRRDNLRLFRKGVFDVLVTCRALDEGLNVPEASVAIIASGTASSRQRIQRMGRVLRPSGAKNSALVYTLYATEAERRRLLEESTRLDLAQVRWMRAQ